MTNLSSIRVINRHIELIILLFNEKYNFNRKYIPFYLKTSIH